MQTNETKNNMLDIVEKVKSLILEQNTLIEEMAGIEKKRKEVEEKLNNITSQIQSTASLLSGTTVTERPNTPKSSIMPQKGIIDDIISVMSETVPMSREEIAAAMEQKGVKINVNSLRSYLSNLNTCFESIKKSDPRYNEMKKKGWILLKGVRQLRKNADSSDGKTV